MAENIKLNWLKNAETDATLIGDWTNLAPNAPNPTGQGPRGTVTTRKGATFRTLQNFADGVVDDIVDAATIEVNQLVSEAHHWADQASVIATSESFIVPGTTEARNLAQRFGDSVNIKDFGALGVGTASTAQDTTAFLAATAKTSIARSIYLPDGTYNISVNQDNYQQIMPYMSFAYGSGRIIFRFDEGIYLNSPAVPFANKMTSGGDITILGLTEPLAFNEQTVVVSGVVGAYTTELTLTSSHQKIIPGYLVSIHAALKSSSAYSSFINGCFEVLSYNSSTNKVTLAIKSPIALPSTVMVPASAKALLHKVVLEFDADGAAFNVQQCMAPLTISDLGLNGKQLAARGISCWGEGKGLAGTKYLSNIGFANFTNNGLFVSNDSVYTSFIVASSCISSGVSCLAGTILGDTVVTTHNANTGFYARDCAKTIFNKATDASGCFSFNGVDGLGVVDGSSYIQSAPSEAAFNGRAGISSLYESHIYMPDSLVHHSGSIGVYVNFTSNAYVRRTKSYNNVASGFECGDSSSIEATETEAYNNEQGYYALIGASIEAESSKSYGNKTHGYSAADGSTIRCKNSKAYNNVQAGFAGAFSGTIRGDNCESYNNGIGFMSTGHSNLRMPGAVEHDNTTSYSMGYWCTIYAMKDGANKHYPTAFGEGTGHLQPATDNTQRLGQPHVRWSTVYLGSNPVVTSDLREKSNVEDIPEYLLEAWGRVGFKNFISVQAQEEKGPEARIHSGVIAQHIKESFEAAGLDAFKYGLLCFDEWEAGGKTANRYGVRYEEALCLEAAYQRWRLDGLEKKLAILVEGEAGNG